MAKKELYQAIKFMAIDCFAETGLSMNDLWSIIVNCAHGVDDQMFWKQMVIQNYNNR